jgi:hypothetical protein
MSTHKDKDDDKPTATARPMTTATTATKDAAKPDLSTSVHTEGTPQRVNVNAPYVAKPDPKAKKQAQENMSDDDKKIDKLTANNETKGEEEFDLSDEQVKHALRVDGRLWRCKAEDCPVFLCVCEKDAAPDQAKRLMQGKYPDLEIQNISAEKLRP